MCKQDIELKQIFAVTCECERVDCNRHFFGFCGQTIHMATSPQWQWLPNMCLNCQNNLATTAT